MMLGVISSPSKHIVPSLQPRMLRNPAPLTTKYKGTIKRMTVNVQTTGDGESTIRIAESLHYVTLRRSAVPSVNNIRPMYDDAVGKQVQLLRVPLNTGK